MRAVWGRIVYGVSLWREPAPLGATFPSFSFGRSEEEGADHLEGIRGYLPSSGNLRFSLERNSS